MRQQPADVVIDEVLTKFRKGEAYQRAHADEIRALAMPPGQRFGAEPILRDAAPGGSEPPAATAAPIQQRSDNWWMPGTITSVAGLGMLGLGVVGGQVLASTSIFGATLAVLLVGVGVIVLVIGLLLLAIGSIAYLSTSGQRGKPAPAPASPAPGSELPPPGTVPL
jgi:hypothetical protein